MDIASYFKTAVPGFGVWLGVDDSEAVVGRNDFTALDRALALEPAPSAIYVKFGGDIPNVGMWGSPDKWAAVRNHAANVVPYLYMVPQNANLYSQWFGLLYGLGFIFCVGDIEYEWDGYEQQLGTVLAGLNPEFNAFGVAGLAWFNGYRSNEAYAGVMNRFANQPAQILYMPQAYVSEITSPIAGPSGEANNGVELSRDWLGTLFSHDLPMSFILDSASLSNSEAVGLMNNGIGGSVWHLDNLDTGAWGKLEHPEPPDTEVRVMRSVLADIGSDIGYAKSALDPKSPAQGALDDAMGKLFDALQQGA